MLPIRLLPAMLCCVLAACAFPSPSPSELKQVHNVDRILQTEKLCAAKAGVTIPKNGPAIGGDQRALSACLARHLKDLPPGTRLVVSRDVTTIVKH